MEEWTRWQPVQGLLEKYSIDSLLFSYDGLTIKLSAQNGAQKIEICFDDTVDSFRSINKKFTSAIFKNLSDKYGDNFYKDSNFFIIKNSPYLQWISRNSNGVSDQFPFVHFCILDSEKIIDILACYQPIVKIIS